MVMAGFVGAELALLAATLIAFLAAFAATLLLDVGDPRASSAELGRLGVEVIVSRTVQAIQKAIAHR
jgi:creatinine amidohydrolase/Fe(II)-dependent formamide hydrolase-like protein